MVWTRGADGWGTTYYVGTLDGTTYTLRKTDSRIGDFAWKATVKGEVVAHAGTLGSLKAIIEKRHAAASGGEES
jgi:hypothetical protein